MFLGSQHWGNKYRWIPGLSGQPASLTWRTPGHWENYLKTSKHQKYKRNVSWRDGWTLTWSLAALPEDPSRSQLSTYIRWLIAPSNSALSSGRTFVGTALIWTSLLSRPKVDSTWETTPKDTPGATQMSVHATQMSVHMCICINMCTHKRNNQKERGNQLI